MVFVELVSQLGDKRGWSDEHQARSQGFIVANKDDVFGYAQVIAIKLAAPTQHWVAHSDSDP
jgi:hypothetical protein